MAFRLGTAARNAACDAIVDLIDAGSPPGLLKIYSGAQPAAVSDNPSGTLLGTLTFSATAFGSSSAGTATASAITSDSSADASNTAAHFAVYNAALTPIADGDAAQGSGTMNFDNATIVLGGVIACTSFTVTVPVS